MKWRREVDYHGSRSYGTDEPKAARFSAWLARLAKIGARKPRSPASSIASLSEERGFSWLGLNDSRVPKPADCPFPMKSADSYDRRDTRVLP
jgi:hypothetical protein